MTIRRERWLERRREMRARLPKLTIQDCQVRPHFLTRGYSVLIQGTNLRPSVVPPQVNVGSAVAIDVSFASDGTRVTGTVLRRPYGPSVTVDLGFASVEGSWAMKGFGIGAISELLAVLWGKLLRVIRRRQER